jgi:hypothetical protein
MFSNAFTRLQFFSNKCDSPVSWSREGEHKLCHQQGLKWLVKSVFFQRVMVLEKLTQVRSVRNADSFVSVPSELALAPFDIVPCRSEQK